MASALVTVVCAASYLSVYAIEEKDPVPLSFSITGAAGCKVSYNGESKSSPASFSLVQGTIPLLVGDSSRNPLSFSRYLDPSWNVFTVIAGNDAYRSNYASIPSAALPDYGAKSGYSVTLTQCPGVSPPTPPPTPPPPSPPTPPPLASCKTGFVNMDAFLQPGCAGTNTTISYEDGKCQIFPAGWSLIWCCPSAGGDPVLYSYTDVSPGCSVPVKGTFARTFPSGQCIAFNGQYVSVTCKNTAATMVNERTEIRLPVVV